MKSCILTVIKNEHEYLKEWIDYHLKLGINCIFIIEDFDSESHKEITDQYPDNVTLFNAKTFLNKKQLQEAIRLKQCKSKSPQSLYFKIGFDYIKSKYSYINWTFVIDNDEFLTLEKGKTLQDIFLEFHDYDAFVIQWQCFGANNLVFKPDYSKKGVVETYTKPMKGKLLDNQQFLVKTCYNMNKSGYLYNMHHPIDKCNWCNTEHEFHSYNPTYKNIYIRHYITRSLEEYIWKKESRGQNTRQDPNLKMFFTINPEMNDKKEEYLKLLRPETLVILPYIQKRARGNELKLCLNAWKKFCTFEYKFIVIGEFDSNLEKDFPWIKFIHFSTKNQHLNVCTIFLNLAKDFGSYEGFIWMFNNYYPIKSFTLSDIKTTHYSSKEIPNVPNLLKTKTKLLKKDLPVVNYIIHYPMYLEFNKIYKLNTICNITNRNYVIENLYFNYFEHDDPVQINEIRLGIWNNDIYKEHFQDALINPNIKFICNSVDGWSEELEYELNNLINDGKIN